MNAIIEITGQIATEDGFMIAKQILAANKNADIQNIVLVINSGGGSTYAIPPIRESIAMCDKKVITIGVGLVASTAMAIFMMGDVRILVPDTDAIIHKTSTGIRDNNPTEDEAEYALECAQRPLLRLPTILLEGSLKILCFRAVSMFRMSSGHRTMESAELSAMDLISSSADMVAAAH
jgi:hypothetical protein